MEEEVLIANFDEQCEVCFGDIEAGYTEITHSSEWGGWIHADESECSDEHPENDSSEFVTG